MPRSEADTAGSPPTAEGEELVRGAVPHSRLPDLVSRLPNAAPFRLVGQRFTASLVPDAADDLLAVVHASLGRPRRGLSPANPGVAAPPRPGTRRAPALERQLAQTLDPGGVLA